MEFSYYHCSCKFLIRYEWFLLRRINYPLIVDIVGKKNYGEAAGFASGVSQVISMSAQFVGSALLLVMSYSSLAFVNAATFLLAGILFASVGIKHQKGEKPLERKEVNEQGFFETMKSSFI